MEYVQLTIDDWMKMKQRLQAELLGIRRSFVRIGYMLRTIDECRGYENDGYKTITEWAKGEYGLEGSTVSRFMSINREYSVGGFSEELLPEYEDFKRSQLEEMLQLPASDRQMISPETSRADIRALKQFNKTAAEGEADELHEFIRAFFDENMDLLKEIYASEAFRTWNIKMMAEMVNPSGNRMYKKGKFFLMMYEPSCKLKKFGGLSTDMPWEEFFQLMKDIFGEELTQTDVQETQQEGSEPENGTDQPESGAEMPESGAEEAENAAGSAERSDTGGGNDAPETERDEKTAGEVEKTGPEGEAEEEVEPSEEPEGKEENCAGAKSAGAVGIPQRSGFSEEEKEHEKQPEKQTETEPETGIIPPEKMDYVAPEILKTRKEYMDTLTAKEMASYMHQEFLNLRLNSMQLGSERALREYLMEPVDHEGNPVG